MIDILLKFAKKTGNILRKNRNNISVLGNKDASVLSLVTQADIQISTLFEKMVKDNFSNLDYIIIDEETISV